MVPTICPRTVIGPEKVGVSAVRRPQSLEMLGQPKIQKLGVATAGHKDVRGFEVAMNNGSFVRRFESIGDLQSQIEKRFQRQRTSSQSWLAGSGPPAAPWQ